MTALSVSSIPTPITITIPFVVRREFTHTVEDNLGLARAYCGKYAKRGQRVEDTEQYSDALLGLLKSTRTYRFQIAEFSTYATECIRREVTAGHRRRNCKKHSAEIVENNKLDVEIDPQGGEIPVEILDVFLAPHPDDTESDIKNRKILTQHYLEGVSWADIGRNMGVSRAAVWMAGQKAIMMIRERHQQLLVD